MSNRVRRAWRAMVKAYRAVGQPTPESGTDTDNLDALAAVDPSGLFYWVATVPSIPGQPADHYEGPERSPNPLDYDPLAYQAGGKNDPTDDDWATGGSTPADEVDARNTYQEYADD